MSREKLLAPAGGTAVTGRRMLGAGVRNGLLVLGLVAVFLTFGLPRWLAGDDAHVATRSDSSFAALCRAHGGTTVLPSPSGPTGGQPFCTVRYGPHVYRMDAITPAGFDDDTARFQRQGCQLANQRDTGSGKRRWTYVYHPRTGVCERRAA